MAVTLEEARRYMRLAPDDDEDIRHYIRAAYEDAKTAGVPWYTENRLFDDYILHLALREYDNRGLAYSGGYLNAAHANAAARENNLILKLRYPREDQTVADTLPDWLTAAVAPVPPAPAPIPGGGP